MPNPKKGKPAPAKGTRAPSLSSAPASTHKPEEVETLDIRRNEKNPRLDFDDAKLDSLAESINDQGVLVPLTIYHDPEPGGTNYVLLDGERRWRAAKLNNQKTVPAWVIEKPSGADNIVRMFNIHMMREAWGEMATARALQQIMIETGTENDNDLRKLTGLGIDRVRNMKRVLQFPKEWQDKVLSGDMPFHILVELDKAVLSKKKDAKKTDVLDASEEDLRNLFLNMYEGGEFSDVVDLRKVGTLIDTAASQKNSPKVRERAQRAVASLLKREASIGEAYNFGAAASVEITNILRDVEQLPERVSDLLTSEVPEDERERLKAALIELRDRIDRIVTEQLNA